MVTVSEKAPQFVIAPGSFLKLSYHAGRFQKSCAPYSFDLAIDGAAAIASTFIEPT